MLHNRYNTMFKASGRDSAPVQLNGSNAAPDIGEYRNDRFGETFNEAAAREAAKLARKKVSLPYVSILNK